MCDAPSRREPIDDVEPDITVEMFFVEGPLPGFGAVEVTQTE
jgi:hypothetical protein